MAGITECGAETIGKTNHGFGFVLIQCVLEHFRFTHAHGQRLFHIDKLTGLHRFNCHWHMQIIGSADFHCVNIGTGNQIVIINKAARAVNVKFITDCLQFLFVDVANRGNLRFLDFYKLGNVLSGGDTAKADDADSRNSQCFLSLHFCFFLFFRLLLYHLFFSYISSMTRSRKFPLSQI